MPGFFISSIAADQPAADSSSLGHCALESDAEDEREQQIPRPNRHRWHKDWRRVTARDLNDRRRDNFPLRMRCGARNLADRGQWHVDREARRHGAGNESRSSDECGEPATGFHRFIDPTLVFCYHRAQWPRWHSINDRPSQGCQQFSHAHANRPFARPGLNVPANLDRPLGNNNTAAASGFRQGSANKFM